MVKHRFGTGILRARRKQRPRPFREAYRRIRVEALEPRYLLAVPTLTMPSEVTLLAGAPLNVALNGSDADSDFLFFTATSGNPQLAASVLDPLGNRSLRIHVDSDGNNIHGDMVFRLFEELAPQTTSRIIDLVNFGVDNQGPFYDGLTFHRVIQDFMIQGGDPSGNGTGGTGVTFDDEFTPELQFTSPGILAMAKSNDDTNDSQFFITSGPTRWLDFNHSIFGFLTEGDDIREAIESVPKDSSDKPTSPVVMSYVETFVDTKNSVLHLSAPPGTTGDVDVTVSVWDADPDNEPVTRTLHVHILPDTNDNSPFLQPIAPIETTANTVKSDIQLPAIDVEQDPIYYDGGVYPDNANLVLTMHSTGQATLEAKNGWAGVGSVIMAVRAPDGSDWDTQAVPVYVNPAKPAVTLQASSDTGPSSTDGITSLNNTPGKTLRFLVSGVVSDAIVTLHHGDTVIAYGLATGDSIILETTGDEPLDEGANAITARQVLYGEDVDVGNFQTIVELESDLSTPLSVTVDTTAPQITSTAPLSAPEGQLYTYNVESSEEATGATYRLMTSPAGMQVNLQTGVVTWTPPIGAGPNVPVTVRVTDPAGNTADQLFTLEVQRVNNPPAALPQNVTTSQDAAKVISLTGDDANPGVTQQLTFALVGGQGPTHGTLSGLDPAAGTVTYTPEPGYVGTDSFAFTVTDDGTAGIPANLTSAPATVSIRVVSVNHPPTANAQNVTIDEDTPAPMTLTGDDGDPAFQQTVTFLIVQQPAHGTLIGFSAQTGAVVYTPAANYNGPDSFTFRTIDDDMAGEPAFLSSTPAEVSITVNAVNDRPVASAQSPSVLQNGSVAIALAGSDGDPELEQPVVFALAGGPSHGTLSPLNGTTGAVTYTPLADYSGPDSFTFVVTEVDTNWASTAATVSLTVLAVNEQPVANPQTVSAAEDTPLQLALSGDDRDPEVTQVLRFAVAVGPQHGTLVGLDAATGAVRYVPAADYNGSDSFTFTVTDDATAGTPANLTSQPATVSITITPVDDAPRFVPVSPQLVLQTEQLRTVASARDPDVPANTIRYSLDPGAPQGVALDAATGQITWRVPESFPAGTVFLSVRATEVTPQAQDGLSTALAVRVTVGDFGLLFAQAAMSGLGGSAGSPGTPFLPSILSEIGPRGMDPELLAQLAANASFQPAAIPFLAPLRPPGDFGPTDLLTTQLLFTYRFGKHTHYGSSPVAGETTPGKPGQPKPADTNPPKGSGDGGPQNPGGENTGSSQDKGRTSDKSPLPTTQAGLADPEHQAGPTASELTDAALDELVGTGALADAADEADLQL